MQRERCMSVTDVPCSKTVQDWLTVCTEVGQECGGQDVDPSTLIPLRPLYVHPNDPKRVVKFGRRKLNCHWNSGATTADRAKHCIESYIRKSLADFILAQRSALAPNYNISAAPRPAAFTF